MLATTGCPRGTDAKRSGTRLELAKDFLRQGDLDAAAAEARKAIAYDRTNVEAYNILGLVHFTQGVNTHRLLEIEDCLAGVDAEGLRQELDAHMAKAAAEFTRAVTVADDYGEAWANRGVVAMQLDDHANAQGYFNKALEHPTRLLNVGLVRANLGWSYFLAGDHVTAAKELRQALQFQPGMCVASYRLGRVYFAREEWDKAAEQFRELAAHADCPIQEAHLYRMKTAAIMGQQEDIATALTACERLAPKSCVAVECRAAQSLSPAVSPADSGPSLGGEGTDD